MIEDAKLKKKTDPSLDKSVFFFNFEVMPKTRLH